MPTFFRRLVLALFRVEVVYTPETVEKLRAGRVLLVCNHQSFLDGIIVALASPVKLCFPVSNRQSREIVFTRFGLQALETIGLGEQIPMNRDHPFGVRTLAKKLSEGGSVAIFPEGRIVARSENKGWMPGYRWLADRTGADVVEISIIGADRSWFFAPEGDRVWPKIRLKF